MALRYLQKFAVVPKRDVVTTFPLDMLRYDCCFFAKESESSALTHGGLSTSEPVHLKRYVEHRGDIPTDARWSSFGWIIMGEVETERLP
jgi:hypothetical protein